MSSLKFDNYPISKTREDTDLSPFILNHSVFLKCKLVSMGTFSQLRGKPKGEKSKGSGRIVIVCLKIISKRT